MITRRAVLRRMAFAAMASAFLRLEKVCAVFDSPLELIECADWYASDMTTYVGLMTIGGERFTSGPIRATNEMLADGAGVDYVASHARMSIEAAAARHFA